MSSSSSSSNLLPYSNDDNPFHDKHLDKVFVWKQKGKKLGWSKDDTRKQAEGLRERNIEEIKNAKRRRIEREIEMETKIRERERLERERDSASYSGWENREEEFMLKQHQQASILRINQGRERPSDIIARNVFLSKLIQFGSDVGPDGKSYMDLNQNVGVDHRDITEILRSLNNIDLLLVKQDLIKFRKLDINRPEYHTFWNALLVICEDELTPLDPNSKIPKAICKSIEDSNSKRTVQEIRMERMEISKNKGDPEKEQFFNELEHRLYIEENRAIVREFQLKMIKIGEEANRGVHRIVNMEDQLNRDSERELHSFAPQNLDEALQAGGEFASANIESPFNDLVEIPGATGIRPNYWNRVRSGYDWNKYNRVHFDRDNPPPKTIFGYKFNIFYPGLKKVPRYVIENDTIDSENYEVIRFIASEPYSDVAFRVEKRKWDRTFNSGFINNFENGVLQLHFNFTRSRYRR